MKIAIQGYAGSFHHQAAKTYFGNEIEIVPCSGFRELFKQTENNEDINGAVMAIENSIVGSILPNYSLLQKSNLLVTGEVYLLINQNLLAPRGVRLKDIREVYSHPMALLQCADFLDGHGWKLVETEDTASTARRIAENKLKHTAAIASSEAAELYNLNILQTNVQTEKTNYTRFLVLMKEAPRSKKEEANKASIFFEIDHHTGSLARILSLIARCGINLSKLQSVAIPQSPWRYAFHTDMEFESLNDFNEAIDRIKVCTEKLIIYGIYKRGGDNEMTEITNCIWKLLNPRNKFCRFILAAIFASVLFSYLSRKAEGMAR